MAVWCGKPSGRALSATRRVVVTGQELEGVGRLHAARDVDHALALGALHCLQPRLHERGVALDPPARHGRGAVRGLLLVLQRGHYGRHAQVQARDKMENARGLLAHALGDELLQRHHLVEGLPIADQVLLRVVQGVLHHRGGHVDEVQRGLPAVEHDVVVCSVVKVMPPARGDADRQRHRVRERPLDRVLQQPSVAARDEGDARARVLAASW
mmetsp:Transcript_44320/g.134332  ORF Transcript_44320/g.134332 Transcript_44320/m.134332 type:complete len:212 (-) Transcript_44320:50-685(-)